ncbi:hypothetical protein [Aliikangiella sp. G2MR2-5]|uniref:hypothetical protein n=1 Tax=Aliikangiella sp. G2MR2-5 TaxID=2788943 RepID=UPI0018AC3DB2|nr:hypothetical protein [Aliikangiella sp. G2MR2-5]
MGTIDYTNYSFQELLEAKAGIDAEAYPDNYNALVKELESRGAGDEERKKRQKQSEEKEFSIAEKRVKIIGYFQIAAAIGIAVLLLMGSFSDERQNSLGIMIGISFVCFNFCAGYTAIKEQYKWYWLSIIN